MPPNEQALDVVYIVDRFPVASETFIQREIEALARRGVRVRVLALRALGAFESAGVELIANGPRPNHARLWLRLGAFLLAHPVRSCKVVGAAWRHGRRPATLAFRVAVAVHFATILDGNPSVIHAHFASVPATVASLLATLIDRPWGFSGHARDLYVDTGALPHKLASASHAFCCSNAAAEDLRRLAPEHRHKVHVVHHGLNLRHWALRDGPPATPRILAIGRFVSKKGFETLIEACALLRDSGSVFECELIGEGPHRESLEARISAHSLGAVVRLSGWRPSAQVHAALSRATVLAVPSVIASDGDRDNIPNVLVEALAVGVPVVASALPAIESLAGRSAAFKLVPPGDAASLALALRAICTDRSIARTLVANGRQLIESQFDEQRNIAALHALLERSATQHDAHTASNCGKLAFGTSRSRGSL